MFKPLANFFAFKSTVNKKTPIGVKKATAVLFYEIIKADSEVTQEEISTMRLLLKKLFHLNEEEINTLLSESDRLLKNSTSLHPFTREICQYWDHQQRKTLLESFWQITLADNQIQADERHLVRKLANLLYLNEKDIIMTREKANTGITP